jgi:hypothetical protein
MSTWRCLYCDDALQPGEACKKPACQRANQRALARMGVPEQVRKQVDPSVYVDDDSEQ